MCLYTTAHLEENLAAVEIELASDDLAALDEAFPPGAAAGDRYPENKMRIVDR